MPIDTFDFDSHRVRGSAADAADWVRRSSLSDANKDALQRFVAKFPTLTFYRDDAILLDHVEQFHGVTLPPWLREVRSTLAFVTPRMRARFDDFEHIGPHSDTMDRIYYVLDLLGYTDDEQQALYRDYAHCFPIGNWPETLRSLLAVKLNEPSVETIYEFGWEDMLDEQLDGTAAEETLFPAFNSYTSMLSHIIELKDSSGNILKAV